jgi:hypothetical protein
MKSLLASLPEASRNKLCKAKQPSWTKPMLATLTMAGTGFDHETLERLSQRLKKSSAKNRRTRMKSCRRNIFIG